MSDCGTKSGLPAGVLGFLGLVILTSVSHADLWIQGYSANLHDRFYTGADRAFIGQGFNWSGVGKNGTWATMISPTYFVSANHYHPGGGSTLTFYEDNTTDHPHTYTVDSTFAANSGDLFLGRLTAPISASDHIGYYPILKLGSASMYTGREIYVYGAPNRVGRNIITSVYGPEELPSNVRMEYDYNTYGSPATVGADEAYLVSGDSGAPSFTNYGGILALLGTHSSHTDSPPALNGWWSLDNFVPANITWLNSKMVGEQATVLLPRLGDANLDGWVDGADFNAVLSNYGRTGVDWSHGDFNGDGTVDGNDLNTVLSQYSESVRMSATAGVPEPGEIPLLLAGTATLLAFAWRRRRRLRVQ
jgi:hypothetical protein